MRPTKHHIAPARAAVALLASLVLLVPAPLPAGGPLFVGGPTFGLDAQPVIWNPAAMPAQYRVDSGPLSQKPDGTIVIDNVAGIARVKGMFDVWQNVATSSVTLNNAGPILATGSFAGGDVKTVDDFNAVEGSCFAGTQSPIIFDADGSIFAALVGDPGVIGFADLCKLDPATGRIVSGEAALNGAFQSGVGFQLTAAEFDQAFVHEFGHFLGLHHSQVNDNVLDQVPGQCNADDLAGLPVLFPFLFCQARTTAGLPALAPDDIAWISRLYPETANVPPAQVPFSSTHGTITGTIFFSDGVTPVQGVNVIARATNSPLTPQNESRRIGVSAVSGNLFTPNLGQSVTCSDPVNPTPATCANLNGSRFGTRDPRKAGSYEIPVPAGTYTVEVESIDPAFTDGSGIGPLDPPIPNPGANEFWNTSESATDDPTISSVVTVAAGQTVSGIDIILNGTPGRFDSFEISREQSREPLPRWLRRDRLLDALEDA